MPLRFLLFLIVGASSSFTLVAAEVRSRSGAEEVASWVGPSSQAFAADLYARAAANSPDNLFFSPSSIQFTLAMLGEGAAGSTAVQFGKVLHLPGTGPAVHRQLGACFNELNARRSPAANRPAELALAMGAWLQKGAVLRPDFQRAAREHYGATAAEVDFAHNPEAARQTINGWAAEQTRGRITQCIPQGGLNSQMRLVLASAIYFKGAWSEPFARKETRDEAFQTPGTGKLVVPMMHRTSLFDWAKGDGFQALRAPCRGGEMSLIVLLPDKASGVERLERLLLSERVGKTLAGMQSVEVQLALPKFHLRSQLALGASLRALGLTEAFGAHADFSGLLEGEGASLSEVLHEAAIDIDEDGAEAAAVSAPMAIGLGPSRVSSKPVIFRADHPFLFLIRHEKTGAWLFVGRVMNPNLSH